MEKRSVDSEDGSILFKLRQNPVHEDFEGLGLHHVQTTTLRSKDISVFIYCLCRIQEFLDELIGVTIE
jgi:hypothetical protein